jgi:hypothetical protein
MVSGGAPRRDSSWLRYSAKELSQCDQWSFKSAAKPENRDGSSHSEIRSIAGICSMAPTSIRNKRFSMRLTQRAMLCRPAARPRSGLKIDRLQRGYSSQSGNQAASAAGVVQSAQRVDRVTLCEATLREAGETSRRGAAVDGERRLEGNSAAKEDPTMRGVLGHMGKYNPAPRPRELADTVTVE